MEIDNFDIIRRHLEFKSNFDRYIVQIIKRAKDEDGNIVLSPTFEDGNSLGGALLGQRMDIGMKITASGELAKVNKKSSAVIKSANEQWTKFMNTGNVLDYTSLLTPDESQQHSKINTACTEYQSQNIPNVIKGTMSWEDYVKGMKKIDTDSSVELLQKYVDLANTGRKQKTETRKKCGNGLSVLAGRPFLQIR